MSRFGDKWSMLVLLELNEKTVMRFGDIHKAIEDISHRMLTVTLRSLEADGLVNRKVYPVVPPHVEYTLTEMGQSLIPHLTNLTNWALEHLPAIMESRNKHA